MELVFQQERTEYLRTVGWEAFAKEETMETIVPDSQPDVARIVDCFGNVLVQTKECRGGAVSVSGGVQAGVLYVPETEDAVCVIPLYIPFSVKKEFAAADGEGTFVCEVTLGSLDARILNSRKVIVRAELLCRFCFLAPQELTLYALAERPDCLQMQMRTMPFVLPLEVGEKGFPLNDELELPATAEPVDRILSLRATVEPEERKQIGNKAVFKGRLCVHLLYCGMDGGLYPVDTQVPFSQYIEMNRDLTDCELRLYPLLSGLEAEPDGQLECRRLLLSASLLVQCVVYGEKAVAVTEDAYCTHGEWKPEWAECAVNGRLDVQQTRNALSLHENVNARNVLDAWLTAGLPVVSRGGDSVQLRTPLAGNILYYDDAGALQGRPVRGSCVYETKLHPQASCRAGEGVLRELRASVEADGIELRGTLAQTVEAYAEHTLRQLSGAEIGEEAATQARRPSVILRRAMPNETLWSIAKSCRTTVADICAANGLTAEDGVPERLLLIPM